MDSETFLLIKAAGEAPRGKPRGIFAEPCEAKNAIPPCGKPQGFLAKKGETFMTVPVTKGNENDVLVEPPQ